MRSRPASRRSTPSGSCFGGRRSPTPPRPTADGPQACTYRCWESRSRSRTTSTSRVCRRCSARRVRFARAVADAEVVKRLRTAGAVIVGKTNTCELGQWPFTSGPAFGHTRNPWSRNHTPGGSSGGSAAAVAAGLVTAAIGSDGAGSVRIPAAWTHLVGIKPQRGRISTWPLPEAFNGITVNGVLARTVTDAALLLDAASGNIDGDRHRPAPIQAAEAVARAPGPLKIALSTKFPFNVLPPPAGPRHPRRIAHRRRTTHRPRAHDRLRRSRLHGRDVVELPVPVDIWAAGLGRPARPRRRAGSAHRRKPPDGTAAVGERVAQGPREGSRRPAPRRLHLQHRRRDPRADDRVAPADRARLRQAQRPVHRSGDDPRLPRDVAVEPARLAVDQRPRRLHIARAYRSACN